MNMLRNFAWVGAALLTFGDPVFARAHEIIPPAAKPSPLLSLSLGSRKGSFRLSTREDLTNLVSATAESIRLSEAQEAEWQDRRKRMLRSRLRSDLAPAELKEYFSEPRDFISKKDRRGLAKLRQLTQAALAGDGRLDGEFYGPMIEIAAAINNNHRPPAPGVIDFLQPPLLWLDYAHNPIACGDTPATNLESPDAPDLSRTDPKPSTFWSPVKSIGSQDLYHGFGRTELPRLADGLLIYAGPKTSYGTGPGFEATSGPLKIKVKFIETMSEPFAARIFGALGYNVEPTDYVPHLQMKYDRRFFKEFHLRKEVQTKIRAAFVVPVYTIRLQKRFDPFAFIDAAVMKDGSRISGLDLKTMLFREPHDKIPEDRLGNFRPDVEERIDYLITRAANVQVEDETVHSIGPWDFDRLGHEDRRELRALGLLAAWVGWFDSRFENTRLKIVKNGERTELKHFISDLGGGLGKSVGPLSRRCESPNEFAWSCTRAPKFQGKGRMTIPFRIVNYQPNVDTLAFERMTLDDARWMARLIGQLSESQILEALVASGFDSARVKLFAEKLISRRDRMIEDLGLSSEIARLRPDGSNRSLSYDPAVQGPVRIRTADGKDVVAPTADRAIENGRIVLMREGEPGHGVPADFAELHRFAH
jgi:hypothetical protein